MSDTPIEEMAIDIAGWAYRVALYPDDDASLNDYTSRTENPAAYESLARGDWRYVGVVVTPVIGGETMTATSDSLWGVEYGDTGTMVCDMTYLCTVYPVPDLAGEARLRALRLASDIMAMDDARAIDGGHDA